MAPEFEFIAHEGPNQLTSTRDDVVIATPSLRKESARRSERRPCDKCIRRRQDKGCGAADHHGRERQKRSSNRRRFRAVRAVPP